MIRTNYILIFINLSKIFFQFFIYGDQHPAKCARRVAPQFFYWYKRTKRTAFNRLQLFMYNKIQILFYIFQNIKLQHLHFLVLFAAGKRTRNLLIICRALLPAKRACRVAPQFFYWYKRTLYPSDTLREELQFL